MTPPMSDPSIVEVTSADVALAELVVSAANIVSHDGYYEVDVYRAAEIVARHRASEAERVREAGLVDRLTAALIERQYQLYLRDGMIPETARAAARTWVEEEFRDYPGVAAIRSPLIAGRATDEGIIYAAEFRDVAPR